MPDDSMCGRGQTRIARLDTFEGMLRRRHSLSRYIPRSCDPFSHFKITRGKAQHGFEPLHCLLARVWADGNFELVNRAWDVLGYSDGEIAGRCVCELIALQPDAARAALKALLTEGDAVRFGLLCKDGRELEFHWNRQFDDFTTSMFIIGDESPGAEPAQPVLPLPVSEVPREYTRSG